MLKILDQTISNIEIWFEKNVVEKVKPFILFEAMDIDRHSNYIFCLGLAIFIYSQISPVLTAYGNRVLPPEADDAYGYIVKAVEMQGCFFQNCPALETLRAQLSVPSSDLGIRGIAFLRERAAHRTLEVYHPLHSVLLLLIYKFTASWEAAYRFLSIIGAGFLAVSIAYWYRHLFGDGIAGIALLLLSSFNTISYPNITPNHFADALFYSLWGMVLASDKKSSKWVLLFGTFCLLTVHTIGRLYALILEFVYWSKYRKNLSAGRKNILILIFVLIVFAYLLPSLVDRPLLAPFPHSFSDNYSRTAAVYQNELLTDLQYMRHSMLPLGSLFPLTVLLVSGLQFLNRSRFQALSIMIGCTVLGIIAMYPGYPGVPFKRLWESLFLLIVGLIACGYWYVINYLIKLSLITPPKPQPQMWLGFVCVIWLFGGNLFTTVKSNLQTKAREIEKVTFRQDYFFDQSQIDFINANDCGDVLYTTEIIRDYFLSHGMLACGAIDHSSVFGTPEAAQWLLSDSQLKYAVVPNPMTRLPLSHNGGILLKAGNVLEIVASDQSALKDPLYFLFDPPDKKVRLSVETQPALQNDLRIYVVKPNAENWLEIQLQGHKGLFVSITDPQDQLMIKGVRLGKSPADLVWPWDSDLMFSVVSNGLEQSGGVVFDSRSYQNLFPKDGHYKVKILLDGGDSILLELDK